MLRNQNTDIIFSLQGKTSKTKWESLICIRALRQVLFISTKYCIYPNARWEFFLHSQSEKWGLAHKIQHILYSYFMKNLRLWVGFIFHLDKYHTCWPVASSIYIYQHSTLLCQCTEPT